MKIKPYLYSQPNHLPRTAIEREQKQFIQIAFAVHLSAVISAERYRSDSGALKSAVTSISVLPCTDIDSKFCLCKTCKLAPPPSMAELIVVYFYIIMINKIEQSAAKRYLNKKLSLSKIPTYRTFENRRSRYKELGKKLPQAYRVYVEDIFLPCDAGDARIFSKEETGLYYYGARYLDPKYSRWLSGDPALNDYIPKAPIDDEAKKHNENLPGMGGVYNTVNLHVYHYAGNNPVKYIDPDGKTFLDDAINFLKGWINYEVKKGQSIFANNTSFVPDPTYEAFNDILRSIDNFSKTAFQDHKFIDESIGKSGTDDEFLKTMYIASGADLRITQGQFNLNAETGIINTEGVLNIHNHKGSNWGISLSGGASSFTGEAALGLKNSALTASIGGSMLEYKGAINLKIGDTKVRLKGAFFIGGLGAGGTVGLRTEFKLAAGLGGSLGFEFRKIEE